MYFSIISLAWASNELVPSLPVSCQLLLSLVVSVCVAVLGPSFGRANLTRLSLVRELNLKTKAT